MIVFLLSASRVLQELKGRRLPVKVDGWSVVGYESDILLFLSQPEEEDVQVLPRELDHPYQAPRRVFRDSATWRWRVCTRVPQLSSVLHACLSSETDVCQCWSKASREVSVHSHKWAL